MAAVKLEDIFFHYCRLDKVDLKPEETPHIGFRADVPAFRSAIRNFGRVDAHSLSLEYAFVDPQTSSASLARTSVLKRDLIV